jgi:uncharacterized membrane protein YheB (UPF0754 family)
MEKKENILEAIVVEGGSKDSKQTIKELVLSGLQDCDIDKLEHAIKNNVRFEEENNCFYNTTFIYILVSCVHTTDTATRLKWRLYLENRLNEILDEKVKYITFANEFIFKVVL